MSAPLISVVIPNRNNGQFIGQCLQSVLEQSLERIEVIVCDDCSVDDSEEIVRHFAETDARVRLIRNTERRGVSQTRNSGIYAATAPFVTTLDSDDYYVDKGKLEAELAVVNVAKAKGEVACGYSLVSVVNSQGNELERTQEIPPSLSVRENMLVRSIDIPRDFVVEKNLLLEIGLFEEGLSLYEDWDLKLRVASRAKFVFSGLVGTAYRQHGGGLSRGARWRHLVTLSSIFWRNAGTLQAKAAFKMWLCLMRNVLQKEKKVV